MSCAFSICGAVISEAISSRFFIVQFLRSSFVLSPEAAAAKHAAGGNVLPARLDLKMSLWGHLDKGEQDMNLLG